MKPLSKLILATTLIAGVAGTAAIAAAPGAATDKTDTSNTPMVRHLTHWFDKLDARKDGFVTIEEALAKSDQKFDKIDTNKDGSLDKAELTAFFTTKSPDLVDRILAKLDNDKDGKITKAEFEKPARKRFALLDLNDDGKVTRDELALAGPLPGLDGRGDKHHDHMNGDEGRTFKHHRQQMDDGQPN
jgi:EF-hand domain pair